MGFVLPVLWLFLTGAISSVISIPVLAADIGIYGEAAPGLLFAPTVVPAYRDILMRKFGILPSMFYYFQFRVFSLIAFNWIFYGVIFYMLSGKLKRVKKQPANGYE